MNIPGLTPTQRRILSTLSDGKQHDLSDLRGLLNDDMAQANTIRVHVTAMRKVLRMAGYDINAARQNGSSTYQLVALLDHPSSPAFTSFWASQTVKSK